MRVIEKREAFHGGIRGTATMVSFDEQLQGLISDCNVSLAPRRSCPSSMLHKTCWTSQCPDFMSNPTKLTAVLRHLPRGPKVQAQRSTFPL